MTTNFDLHFTTTANQIFPDGIKIFYAPALPLGNDFNGIVYLHGSAAEAPHHCVLTDEDFGRAYLTQAWASRFLAAMFSQYVVLFVGYSHDDTVMNYLTRGLPPVPQEARFAFTFDDEKSLEKWSFLGIRPVTYKKRHGRYPHYRLKIALHAWVNEINRGLFEKAQRIREIAEAQPPLEGKDADYIKFSLRELRTGELFFKYARAPEWISWLEKEGFLKGLFDHRIDVTEFDRAVAYWLTAHFLAQHPAELMGLIQRHGPALHPQFCCSIARRLLSQKKQLNETVFSQWIAILTAQPIQSLPYDEWCLLLNNCRFPEEKIASLRLFDLITNATVHLKEPWHVLVEQSNPPKVDFELNLSQNLDHWLSKAWDSLFKPNLPSYANDLAAIVTANLAAAHGWIQACGRGGRDYDPFRLHRQSIDHASDVRFKTILDLLIDAARAVIDELVNTRPRQAATIIEMWLQSDAAILRRLAIYGFSQRKDLSDDDKLHWLLENDLLYLFKTDVFEFLDRSYPKSGDSAKQRIIERALQGCVGDASESDEERTRQYEIYNLMVWLARIAPDSEITRKALDRVQQDHPDFAPRGNPELDLWIGGVETVQPTEGFDFKQIAAEPPSVFLDKLKSWQPKNQFDEPRSNFCTVVARVTTESPEWGVRWLELLKDKGLIDADLWQSVCQGWRNADLKPHQWQLVIEFAENIDAPPEFFTAFAEVLEHGSTQEQYALPDELMEGAQTAAERIWEIALAATTAQESGPIDWFTLAINRPGGKLARFWLQRISVARKSAGNSWQGLPSSIANKITEMLRSSAGAAAHVRVVFASHLHYVFSLDAKFANQELLPLFDWQADALKAEQCWQGFLFWGRWLGGFTERLLPLFDEAISRLELFPKELRERAIDHIAGLALFRFEDPLTSGWLGKILPKLSTEDRDHLAHAVHHLLNDTDPHIAEKIWDRWLKNYWEMRLLGTPMPLSSTEATEMVFWAVSFGCRVPEAVKFVQRMADRVTFEHTDLLLRINQKGIAKSQPEACAELVLFFLQCNPRYFFVADYVSTVWQDLKTSGVSEEKLQKIREAMFALGHDPEQLSA